jgi:putative exosortase-associated protein (TIGR04073 family)
MKRTMILTAAAVLALSLGVPASADNAVDKLGRGLANVLTSPIEVVQGMSDVNEEHGMIAGATIGTLQGVVNLVKRAGVGLFEIVTFPIPIPGDYGPILTEPEFFLDKG